MMLCFAQILGGAKSPDDTFIRALGNKILQIWLGTGLDVISQIHCFHPMFNREILKIVNLNSNDFTMS